MTHVTMIDRKSKALTPSNLRCLSHLPTINLTAGCVHDCVYCYIRGYSQYPGENSVVVYRNTAEQVQQELSHKRKRPLAVYFSPSSDAFMPVDEVLDQAYRTMRLLLDHGIGIQFVTKGPIPEAFIDLFAKRPELVAGQIGLCTLDDSLNAVIEPHAALAQRRLADLRRLIVTGVTASLRADPLIYGVTDLDADLDSLFTQASACGVRHVSASYLFLRPAIVGAFKRQISNPILLQRILSPYENAKQSNIRGSDASSRALLAHVRRAELDRVGEIAQQHGLELNICGCKNDDLTLAKCHLTNLTMTIKAAKPVDPQALLW